MKNSFYALYYKFNCMNSIMADRLWHESAFKNEAEAISVAADYEATLIRIKVNEKGNVIERTTVFKPN